MLLEKHYFHFVGIGGIGMSALAKFLIAKEKQVSGSDVCDSEIVQEIITHGIHVAIGHTIGNLPETTDVLVYSSAVPLTNSERELAREKGIPEVSYSQFLGEVSKTFSTIVVTGTHGKSTTTAMIGLILEAAGYDPTVLVGSFVPTFPEKNLRIGKGRFFVVEGCEYQANMLNLHPEMIVLTNIEEDHLDYYRDINHIRDTFQIFADKLIGKGMMILNANDAESMKLNVERPVTYCFPPPSQGGGQGVVESESSYTASDRVTSKGEQSFSVRRGTEVLGRLKLIIPGLHNVMNAIAATSAAMELGVPFETCARVLETFSGIWRRFERVGTWHQADVISDYGHHPTAIKKTIEAAREFFSDRRIVLCFQPHQHSRTKSLFNGFIEVLQLADETIVTEIYDVAGRNEEHEMSSRLIVEKIKKENSDAHVFYSQNFVAVKSALENLIRPNDVLIIMGAGDIDVVARDLINIQVLSFDIFNKIRYSFVSAVQLLCGCRPAKTGGKVNLPKPVYVKDLFGGKVTIIVFGAPFNWNYAGTSREDMEAKNTGITSAIEEVMRKYDIKRALVPKPAFNAKVVTDKDLPNELNPNFFRGADADGVLITKPGDAYFLASADCLAGIIFDPRTRSLAALHCGRDALIDRNRERRAGYKSVIDNAVRKLVALESWDEYQPGLNEEGHAAYIHVPSKNPEVNFLAFLAAGISPNSFDHPTLNHPFAEENARLILDLRQYQGVVTDEARGSIDLFELARQQLAHHGVIHIENDEFDTATSKDGEGNYLFHSNRREKFKRNLVVIILN